MMMVLETMDKDVIQLAMDGSLDGLALVEPQQLLLYVQQYAEITSFLVLSNVKMVIQLMGMGVALLV